MTGLIGVRAIGIAVGCCIGLFAVAASAQQLPLMNGQDFASVQNWQPNDFSISCGTEDDLFRPPQQQTACIRNYQPGVDIDQARVNFEIFTWLAARFFQTNKFDSPYRFGPVIDAFDGIGKSIRVFTNAPAGDAAAIGVLPTDQSGIPCDREGLRIMKINPSSIMSRPAYAIAKTGAHELFHAVQMGIPGNLSPNSSRKKGCLRPDWIDESQADAVGIDFMRREFPSSFPPATTPSKFGIRFAGIRPYYYPLNLKDKSTNYNTNSFWLYLGDRFHGKRFNYVLDYSKVPAPKYAGGKEDWLRWLDQQLLNDKDVNAPLSLVYPAFLTNFAAEWYPGGIGENFKRTIWLTSIFGGCEQVTVSRLEPYVEFDLILNKVAGKCLSVTVTGLGPSDLASVKIGALADSVEIADSLHLGFAFTNDQTGFNCAKITREGKLPGGIVGCLLEPVTGVFETAAATIAEPAARMWNGTSVEIGAGPMSGGTYIANPSPQASGPAGLDIENVYILSYVPTKPWEELLEGKPPINVKIGIGLDVATLTVDGVDVNSGAADGKRSSVRIRAASGLAGKSAETDRILPASTGYEDLDQAETLFGPGLVGLIASATKLLSAVNDATPGLATFKYFVFRVAETKVTPLAAPAPIDDEVLDVIREYNVFIEEKLPLGTTGTFDAAIAGLDFENTNLGYVTMEDDWAKLTVLENSRGAFRARVQGRLCQTNLQAIMSGSKQRCQRIIPFSASITKPFGYLYQSNTEFISQQTEGERIYNKYNLVRVGLGGPGGLSAGGPGGASSSSPGASSASATAGSVFVACPDPAARLVAGQCQTPQAPAATPPPPNLAAQIVQFTQLLSGHVLSPVAQQMLISDFATMSDQTRAYLITKYQNGN